VSTKLAHEERHLRELEKNRGTGVRRSRGLERRVCSVDPCLIVVPRGEQRARRLYGVVGSSRRRRKRRHQEAKREHDAAAHRGAL
jgi:hypothetical protein